MFAVDAGDAAVSVTHIFAKTNISDRDELGTFLFNFAQRFLNDAVCSISAARLLIFVVGNSEEQDRLQPRVLGGTRLVGNFIDRELKNAGHARDGAAFVDLVAHEKRQNEIVRGQISFANKISQRG